MCRTQFLVVNAASFHPEFLGKTRGNGDGGFDQVAALLKNVKERIPRKLPDLFMGLVLNVGRFGKNHFGKLPKTVSAKLPNCHL
jgi:hypothetical protein